MKWPTVPASELMLKRGGSVNPANFPEETFELLSIPAFDKGEPEIVEGSAIGSSKSCVQPGDVLLSKIVPHIRRCWVVPEAQGAYRQIGSGEWMIFRGDSFYSPYLKHFLTSDHFHRQFMNTVAGVGGSLVRARPAEVERIEIPLPPLAEQERIAAILDKADAVRRKRNQATQLADDFLRALFLDMFGDPVTNPKGWEVKPLGSLVINKDGQRVPIKASDRSDIAGEYPYYGASGVIDYVNQYIFEGRNLLIGEDGANLLARSTPIAFIADGKYWVNNHAHVLGEKDGFSLDYLAFSINLRSLEPFVSGSAQPKLNQENLNKIPVQVPPEHLVSKFLGLLRWHRAYLEKMDAWGKEDLFGSLSLKAFSGQL